MDNIGIGYREEIGDYLYKCMLSTETGELGWRVFVKDDCKDRANYDEIVSPYKGMDVISLRGCFSKCRNMVESPVLPDTAYDLSMMFEKCVSLVVSPALPKMAVDMWGVFLECKSLKTPPVIPPNVTNMGFCFFESGIKTVPMIPKNVYSLCQTFSKCYFIDSIDQFRFPTGSEDLEVTECFYATGIKNVPEDLVIPPNIDAFKGVFTSCTKLIHAKFVIPPTVKDISYLFAGCSNLISLPTMSEGIKVASHTFSFCESLKKLPALPESVTEGRDTFRGCFGAKIVDKDFRIPPNDTPKGYFARFPELETVPVQFRKKRFF